jgi:hypothetical protein
MEIVPSILDFVQNREMSAEFGEEISYFFHIAAGTPIEK